jgi:hypothetical protein
VEGWLYKRYSKLYGSHSGLGEAYYFGMTSLCLHIDRLPFQREWTWTAQVFLTLHTIVLLMKMHSYAFYNGHLSETEIRLHALDEPSTASQAPAYQYPSAGHTPTSDDRKRQEADEKSALARLREDLAIELTSPMGSVTYPKNLTWANYADFIFCPTLCYELEYPRTDGIVWSELGYKVLATFGVIFLLVVTSEEFILPVMIESAARLETVTSFSEIALILSESISLLLFPFMITFLLVFLVIFEYVLGAFAEITCEFSESCVAPLTYVSQALQIGTFTPTGGTVPIGLNSLASGTFLSITSSADTCIAPHDHTSAVQWLRLLPSSSVPLAMRS